MSLRRACNQLVMTVTALVAVMALASCNKDEVITTDAKPVIELDSDTGVYTVKTGRELTIAPTYLNVDGADYAWVCDGVMLATTPVFTHTWEETGTYYLDLTVTTDAGSATEQMRVDVIDLAVPAISLPLGDDVLTLALGSEFMFNPEIASYDALPTTVEWKVNGRVVSDEPQYTFRAESVGDYDVVVTASNADGSDSRLVKVKVLEHLPFVIEFPTPSLMQKSTTRYTFAGRPVYLTPFISGATATSYAWSVDGRDAGCSESTFIFTPEKPGTYLVSILVNGTATASVEVVCVEGDEASRFRRATGSSKATATTVFEWVPAPGQFINETGTGGMTGAETTPEAANAWAARRLESGAYVSLGAWGGYIIVGFDHSIPCTDGNFALGVDGNAYDFAVLGNALLNAGSGQGGSNEPGIVYVMQDVNGNGLPDDEWYELRGSETGQASTWQDYAVTYYRPAGPAMAVQWTDNRGQSGTVDYLNAFHRQDYYYPAWIPADSYTLRGTRLAARTTQDPDTGLWDNWAFPWGYTDNIGSDNLAGGDSTDGSGQRNGLLIENAMYPSQQHIPLQYIDFVKVQTGVQSKAGWLGENSTEVCGFIDLTMSAKKSKPKKK